jgi:hypothetical protein
MSYSVPAVTNWARVTYNEAPDPRSMLAILEAMDATLTDVANLRKIFALDDAALAAWDDDASKLYLRIRAYYEQRNAMAAGEITGQYTAHVVAPILHGQGYASPGQELWSKVRAPDVGTPFSLANQLFARAEVMGMMPAPK